MCLFTELGKFSQLIIGKNRAKSQAVSRNPAGTVLANSIHVFAGKVKKKAQENENEIKIIDKHYGADHVQNAMLQNENDGK